MCREAGMIVKCNKCNLNWEPELTADSHFSLIQCFRCRSRYLQCHYCSVKYQGARTYHVRQHCDRKHPDATSVNRRDNSDGNSSDNNDCGTFDSCDVSDGEFKDDTSTKSDNHD